MPTNGGDSGSAVVNDKAEVVGVHSGCDGRPGVRLVSWAIELSELKAFLNEVRPFLGEGGASAQAHHRRGLRYLGTGRLDKAVADFTAAVRLDRDFAEAYRNRGRAYYLRHDHDSALQDLNKALELNANDALAYNERGHVWLSKGDRAKALADYTRAIRLGPRDAVIRCNRGSLYVDSGRPADAIRDFNEAIELAPRYARAFHERGRAHYNQRDYAKAVADFQSALDRQVTADTFNWLGVALHAQRDYARALAAYTRALELNHPNPALVRTNRGIALTESGKNREAIPEYDLALRINPKHAPAFLWRGTSYENLGDARKAHADYEKAVQLSPGYDKVVPVQTTRTLRVKNDTGEKLRIYLRYEARNKAGQWGWCPAANSIYYDLQPGEVAYLAHDNWRIHARTVRIWAESRDGTNQWFRDRDRDVRLVEAGYRSRNPGTYNYTFTR
jgi:tetratricopeptide (TPR) repeat protein